MASGFCLLTLNYYTEEMKKFIAFIFILATTLSVSAQGTSDGEKTQRRALFERKDKEIVRLRAMIDKIEHKTEKKAEAKPKKAEIKPEKAEVKPEKAEIKPEKAEVEPKKVETKPKKAATKKKVEPKK